MGVGTQGRAERVLFLLTLWAYVRYVEGRGERGEGRGVAGETNSKTRTSNSEPPASSTQPPTPRPSPLAPHTSTVWYLLALLLFALGLMSKPMLVTVPFVLLLLDYWPLKRIAECGVRSADSKGQSQDGVVSSQWSVASSGQAMDHKTTDYTTTDYGPPTTRKTYIVNRILLEKVPFLALSLAMCVVTFQAQQQVGAVHSLDSMPLGFRVANAVISYVRYPAKMLWPTGLAVLYPAPAAWPIEEVLGAALLLLAVTAVSVWRLKRAPYLAVGWFWYLGMLVPVIGIVQVGNQAMADRYTYLPLIGLLVMAAWSAADIAARWALARPWVAAGGVGAVLLCGVLTWQQAGRWRSSFTLFEHALAVTSGNAVAHNNLGACLFDRGDSAGAEPHFAEAVRLHPRYALAIMNLGLCRELQGRTNDALELVGRAAQIEPYPQAEYNLARLLAQEGRLAEAESHYQSAVKLQPEFADAWCNLGVLHAKQGRREAAARDYAAALRVKPAFTRAHLLLGGVLGEQKEFDGALAQFNAVLRVIPAMRMPISISPRCSPPGATWPARRPITRKPRA